LPFDDPLTITLIAAGAIIACLIVIYAMRKRGKKEEKTSNKELPTEFKLSPFKIMKTVPKENASRAKDELRLLDLEREVLSDAIRHLYEAQAEGKITEEEREQLAQSYKSRMMTVRDAISKDESLVALHELEVMQEDLLKLFNERFDELGSKIEELRGRTETETIKEIPIRTETQEQQKPSEEEKARKKKRQPLQAKPSPRTEAEKRIEEIRSEVEKVLDRLGQMENET
jgi:hypothetical protein